MDLTKKQKLYWKIKNLNAYIQQDKNEKQKKTS